MTPVDREAIALGAEPGCDCNDCLAIYERVLNPDRNGSPRMVRCHGRDAKLQPLGLNTCLRKVEHAEHKV